MATNETLKNQLSQQNQKQVPESIRFKRINEYSYYEAEI